MPVRTQYGTAWKLFVCIGAFLSIFSARLSAIVVADDPDAHVVPTARCDIGMVGHWIQESASGTIAWQGAGTLIAPQYVLLAKHEVGSWTCKKFKIDGQTYSAIACWSHPEADIAILKLDRSTMLPGYRIDRTLDHRLRPEVILVGYGYSGVGGVDASAYPRGVCRYGYNRVDGLDGYYLMMDFDDPMYEATPSMYALPAWKEACTAEGDSGGPTLICRDGIYYVAGIHKTISLAACPYTTTMFGVAVRSVASWIDGIVPVHAVPGDANADRRVDAADLAIVRRHLGAAGGATWAMGDFDGDGAVTDLDQRIVSDNYGIGVWTVQNVGTMPGDANGDKQVDNADFDVLAVNFGIQGGATWAMGDFTGDGAVDAGDYAAFADHYGWGVPDLSQVSDLPDCPGTGRITATVVLENYVGDLTQVPVQVRLFRAGVVVRDVPVVLDSQGRFVLRNVPGGTYGIWVKAARWLATRKNNIPVEPALPDPQI